MSVRAATIRFPVEPRDVPAVKAARRLGMTEAEFAKVRDQLFSRGFPRPDPDTGRYDLKAIDVWMDQRSSLTVVNSPIHAGSRIGDKINALQPSVAGKRTK